MLITILASNSVLQDHSRCSTQGIVRNECQSGREIIICILLGLVDDLSTRSQQGTHTLYYFILQVLTEV
jgi:hypothetical protein